MLGLIFSIPVLSYTSNKIVHAPFLSDNDRDIAVVFFGFAGCSDVCPAAMSLLEEFVTNPDIQGDLPQVAFIDIDNQSNPKQADAYAKHYHPDFIGYFPSTEEMALFTDTYGLKVQQRGNRINHQGRAFLLKRNQDQRWQLVKTYTPDSLSIDSFLQDID